MKHRVVITGLGIVAPNGIGKEAFWQALMNGLSGVRSIRRFDTSTMATGVAGEIVDLDPLRYIESKDLKKVDRSNLYAIAAGQLALEDSGLDLAHEDLERIGSSIGNSVCGVDYVDKEIDVMREKGPRWGSPYLAIAFFACGTNGLLSIRMGLKGVVLTLCNGNTSATDAIGLAFRSVQSGRADVMFAGGTEAPLVPLFVGSLSKDGLLSQRRHPPETVARPFDISADGMVLSEGAGLIVMESYEHARARGAPIYAELIGYASGNSAFDALRPEPNGNGLEHTMRRALRECHLSTADVDTIHAQGLSLADYDDMEARCVDDLFGRNSRTPQVTAVSSLTGNAMGALGGFQAVANALILEREKVPPIANVHMTSSRHPIAVVINKPASRRVEILMQNSFCFLGKSSTLIYRRFS